MTLTPTLLVLALAVPQQSGGFTDGQLVLLDRALNGPSSTSGGIAIIDPLSGSITKPYSFFGTSGRPDTVCYDPYRDRILFNANPTSSDPLLLLSGDALGNYEVIGFPNKPCQELAPVGDGRIYFRLDEAPTNTIRLLDANDQVSIVQDGSGQPYVTPFIAWSHLEYHVATNSLLHVENAPETSCGSPTDVTVHRIDLSPDGTQVLGDACLSFPVDLFGSNQLVGLSPLDAESMLLTVATPQGVPQPQLLRIQVEPLAVSVYSPSGPYFASAWTRAGAFSRLRNQAVLYDTYANALRAFSPGQGGDGYLVTPMDSLGTTAGFGQTANLTEVDKQATAVGILTAEPQAIGIVTGGTVTLQLEAGPTAMGQLHLVVGSLSGVAPGIPLGSSTVPLVPDAYFFLTLSAGSPLTNAIGFLDAEGMASASLSLGPLPVNFVGLVAQHAAVLLDPVTLALTGVTSPVAVPLIP